MVKDLWLTANTAGKKVMFCGNGGSAAIASHCAVDLSKNAGIRAVNFNEASLITCLANDFGYENWMAKAIDLYADAGDVLVLVSSSGNSKNIINCALAAKSKGVSLVSFTGFDRDNNLNNIEGINFWVDSKAYNVVEMTHNIWLLSVIDKIIGKAEYSA
jgi:D-sedoheptulose 7-phosphate isomerase